MKFNKIKKNIIKSIKSIKNIAKNKYILSLIVILTIIAIIVLLIYFFKKYESFSNKQEIMGDYFFLAQPSNNNFLEDTLISNFIESFNKNAKTASTTVQLPVKITKPYQDDNIVKYLRKTVINDELKYYIKYGHWPYCNYVLKWLNNDKKEINKLQQFFGNKPATIHNLQILFSNRATYQLLIFPSESKLSIPPYSYQIYSGMIKPPQTLHYLSEDEYNSLVNSCKSNDNNDDYEKYKHLEKPPNGGYNWSDDTINSFVPFFPINTNKILNNPDTTVHQGPPFNSDPYYQIFKGFATDDEAKYYIKNGAWEYPTHVTDWVNRNLDKLNNYFENSFNNSDTLKNITTLYPPLLTYLTFLYNDEQNDKTKKSVQYFTRALPPPQPNSFSHLCNEIIEEEYDYNY